MEPILPQQGKMTHPAAAAAVITMEVVLPQLLIWMESGCTAAAVDMDGVWLRYLLVGRIVRGILWRSQLALYASATLAFVPSLFKCRSIYLSIYTRELHKDYMTPSRRKRCSYRMCLLIFLSSFYSVSFPFIPSCRVSNITIIIYSVVGFEESTTSSINIIIIFSSIIIYTTSLPRLNYTSPYLTSPLFLISFHLTSPRVTSSHSTSPYSTSPYSTSPYSTSPQLNLIFWTRLIRNRAREQESKRA